jgi:hypothetical protein
MTAEELAPHPQQGARARTHNIGLKVKQNKHKQL